MKTRFNMKAELICVANFLKTRYESKGHGGWNIYEDEKILIRYDTYYPNIDVSIKMGDKWITVLLTSGHGYDQEYHSGHWEMYVADILYPRALKAKEKTELNEKLQEELLEREKFAPIDDSRIFSS